VIVMPLQEVTMASIFGSKLRGRFSAALTAGIILSATFAVAALPTSASAEGHRGGDRGHRDWHRGGGRWGGGYYQAPPVVYGSPYYAAPPVVYGSPFGLSINIR
jgi:hypothetical protein